MSSIILNIKSHILGVVEALVLLLIGWWSINKISKVSLVFFHRAGVDTGITSFLNSSLKFCLKIILLAAVMSCVGFDVTSILAAIGASFIAIGISLKDSLSNFISGMVLIVTKPIHVGDFIEFEKYSGTVVKIEMLFTTLQTGEEDKTVIIPNTKLISNSIVRKSGYNLSRLEFQVSLNKDVQEKEIDRFLSKEFLGNNCVCQLPAPEIKVEEDENKKIFHIIVWCQDRHIIKTKEDIREVLERLSVKCKNLEKNIT